MTKYGYSRITWFCLLVGAVLSILVAGIFVHRARCQQEAAYVFREQLNSVVLYDFEEDRDATKVPAWVRSWCGDDLFNNVVSVGVNGHETNDEDIGCLECLPGLALLNLSETKITDSGLRDVAKCYKLRVLEIAGTTVGDAGLRHLAHMKNLSALNLSNTRITNEGLAHLCTLKNLSSLELSNTRITDEGLVHLRTLTSLKDLEIAGTGIVGSGLRHLQPFANLLFLGLASNKLAPGTLATVAALPSLEELDLSATNVDDSEIMYLEKSRCLRRLWLYRTSVSKERTESLRRKLPGLIVCTFGRL